MPNPRFQRPMSAPSSGPPFSQGRPISQIGSLFWQERTCGETQVQNIPFPEILDGVVFSKKDRHRDGPEKQLSKELLILIEKLSVSERKVLLRLLKSYHLKDIQKLRALTNS